VAWGVALPSTPEAASSRPKTTDLVVLRSERWIDTVQGTLKSLAARPADEVVIEVRFRDKKKKLLGSETVKLGPMEPGQEREFQVPMPEKVRKAASWEIIPRALWRANKR
jgi:hypothetical protein